jgi:capsular polysaccharide biosynthesis protein
MSEPTSVKTVGGALWHRRWLLLASLVACLMASGAAATLLPASYQAQATLVIDGRAVGNDADSSLTAGETLARYYVVLATSRRVLDEVIVDLGWKRVTPDALAKRVDARILRGTSLLEIRGGAGTAAESAALANSVAKFLVQESKREATIANLATREYLDAELKRLDGLIQELQRSPVPTDPGAVAARQFQLNRLDAQYGATYAKRQDLALAQARGTGAVRSLEQARLPKRPVSPDPLRYGLAAVVVGLCLGGLLALLAERWDDRLFSPAALAEATSTTLVVAITRVPAEAPPAVHWQPYAMARANLRARYPKARTVLVAAASARDPAHLFATGLAHDAAAAGQRVLLLQGDGEASGTAASANGDSLTTLPLGSLDSDRQAATLAEARDRYDLAILSVPSPDSQPIVLSLARSSDVAILVATARVTRFAEARQAAESLRRAGVELAASVLLPRHPSPLPNGLTAQP